MSDRQHIEDFGEHVRSLRLARGLTQEQLAGRCSLAADTIRRLEQGSLSPSLNTLERLATGLHIRLATFFLGLELGERDPYRELADSILTRSPQDVALALKVLGVLFDDFDRRKAS